MLYTVGTQFRFTDNDFAGAVVTTPAERAAARLEQPERVERGYMPGTKIIFVLVQSSLQILTIRQPHFAAA